MNGKERFNSLMNLEVPDRAPLFEDGIRDEVLRSWRKEGLARGERLENLFVFDRREEIEPELEPIPQPSHWPVSLQGLQKLAQRLDPENERRLPENWSARVKEWKTRDYPLILRVHRGYFLTLGVHGWHRFTEATELLVDNPQLVEAWMNLYAEFTGRLADRVLDEVDVDAVLFSEPIGGNHGPLISPKMYQQVVLKSYIPILERLKRRGVTIFIYRTYANTRVLLPGVVEAGFNCLWACECNPQAVDYRQIRQEFGTNLRLIGGIDSDSLRHDREEIKRAVMDVVPGLLKDGGYIPLADGRVREDVKFDNYRYYRQLLQSVVSAGG
jgi:Uroporphyrinogen decarboxylase (URO-D)